MIEMSGSEFLVAVLLSIFSGFALSNLMSSFKKQERDENKNESSAEKVKRMIQKHERKK